MKTLTPKIKEKIGQIFSATVMISFVAPIGFLLYKIVTTSNSLNPSRNGSKG